MTQISKKLCGVHHQCALQPGVKIEIFVSLWLLLKGKSGEILLVVNISMYHERKDLNKKFLIC